MLTVLEYKSQENITVSLELLECSSHKAEHMIASYQSIASEDAKPVWAEDLDSLPNLFNISLGAIYSKEKNRATKAHC